MGESVWWCNGDRNIIDLHMHTRCSDGALLPEELMQACQKAGLSVVAVADHDTINGVVSATQLGQCLGLRVIPACEISVSYGNRSLHLLAYNINLQDAGLGELLSQTSKRRLQRNELTVSRLQEYGFTINWEVLRQATGDGAPIMLRHIAQHVVGQPENAELLKTSGVGNTQDFFKRFTDPDCPAYVPRDDPPIEQAISCVHKAGGVAVLAHPGISFAGQLHLLPDAIAVLARQGLDGIETFHGWHTREATRECRRLARQWRLFETAGSDFHQPQQGGVVLGGWPAYRFTTPRFPDWAKP